jgi:hypothetical protein
MGGHKGSLHICSFLSIVLCNFKILLHQLPDLVFADLFAAVDVDGHKFDVKSGLCHCFESIEYSALEVVA